MPILDSLCRGYQRLFRRGHPEEARLVELHSTGQTDQFLREYFDHEYQKGAESVARFAKITTIPTGRALDFGCGAGGLTFRIAETCGEAVGIDIESERYKVEFAESQRARLGRDNARFVCYAGGIPIPFEAASFDCAFCVDVVEHLPTPEKFIAELFRVLKPGGKLLLSFGPPWRHAHGKHLWAKFPGWWTHLLFPRRVVMRVGGYPENATWEDLGMFRLTVRTFNRIMRLSGFERLYHEEKIKTLLKPLKLIPWVRELFIAEIVGVYQKPAV
jgi:SAM-dependent methyltransferase